MSFHTILEPAVAVFGCGLTLLWLGGVAFRLDRGSPRAAWVLLAVFAWLQGLAQFGLLASGAESPAWVGSGSLLLSAGSYFSLIEFGRRGIKRRGQGLLKPWIYAVVIAIAAAILSTGGLSAAVRYGVAIPGGIAAAIAAGQTAREQRVGWPLALASAAIALFVLGDVVSIAPLRTFAALGLIAGVWVECRAVCPLPSAAGGLRRWRAPVGFAIMLVVGSAGVAAVTEVSGEHSVLALAATDPTSDPGTDSSEQKIAPAEVDSRTLARQRADDLRYKQGLTLLGALGVMAVVWVCLARFAAAR